MKATGSSKDNQHYVPRFWLRRFAAADGRLAAMLDGVYQHQVDVDDIMSGHWIYTAVEPGWIATDKIEDCLAALEGLASRLFDELHANTAAPSNDQWTLLCSFLALQACRHIDVMARGHDRSKEMALALAEASSFAIEVSFLANMKLRFGCDLPPGLWGVLKCKGDALLMEEAEEVFELYPYDPQLPAQDSLRATNLVCKAIAAQNLCLLDAPLGSAYVLGDRPVPLRELAGGFDVPLSSSLAFNATPAPAGAKATRTRRVATAGEVAAINKNQKARAKSVLIAQSKPLLESI
jgi:hypothetical protein